jgi:threonylcarbamoyladenosine tRNA methylthiotransferase MtaB
MKARRLAAVNGNVQSTCHLPPIGRFPDHQRAFVKIQDGCDAFCSYCIVSFTRPKVWSRPEEEILEECSRLVLAGHREIVLCGVFLGAFGRASALRRTWKAGGMSPLAGILRKVCRIDGLWRARLSSLEPGDVTDDLLEVLAGPKAEAHLHLPLQTGSPEMLRRANRQYTADQFRQCVRRIRSALDRPAITTDIIVGLPGETDDDFAMTLEMAREAGFSKIHAFPFSPLEPTAAWAQRREAPSADVVRARLGELARLEASCARDYRMQFVGETVEAVAERPSRQAALRQGLTDRHLAVSFAPAAGEHGLTGKIIRLRIDAVTATGLHGTQV